MRPNSDNEYILQDYVALKDSYIWALQRDSIIELNHGFNNPTHARRCAELIISMLRDSLNKSFKSLRVIELCAGRGQFSFHLINAIELITGQAFDNLPLKYLQLEPSEINIQFCLQQPQLEHRYQSGELEIAQLNIDQLGNPQYFSSIRPRTKFHDLDLTAEQDPIFVIANATLAAFPSELYLLRKQSVYTAQLKLCLKETFKDKNVSQTSSESTKNIAAHWRFVEHNQETGSHYSFEQLLANETQCPNNAYWACPVRLLQLFDSLKQEISSPLLFYFNEPSAHLADGGLDHEPSLDRNNLLKLPINKKLLLRYAQDTKAQLIVGTENLNERYSHFLLMFNDNMEAWSSLQFCYVAQTAHYDIDDYAILKDRIQRSVSSMTVAEILAWLRQSHYDSEVFKLVVDRLIQLCLNLDNSRQYAFENILSSVWNNHYRTQNSPDMAGLIALILCQIESYPLAQQYLNYSEQDFGVTIESCYLKALCCFNQREWHSAEMALTQLFTMDPSHQLGYGLYKRLKQYQTKIPNQDYRNS